MCRASALEATVVMEARGDARAPGAAITLGLCGSWEHELPCPLAPHHTSAERADDEVRLRVLFVAEPEDEAEVRARIRAALQRGNVEGPDGATVSWRLGAVRASEVREDEAEHVRRLMET
ncbi:hypothetical protein ACWGI8_13475 [Streptomyces sp. NPDC054841]